MAVARPQKVGESGAIKIALIVFVVLTVAALAFAIILYTKQEELQNRAADAIAKTDGANKQMNEAQQQFTRWIMEKIDEKAASSGADFKKINQAINDAMQPVLADERFQAAQLAKSDNPAVLAVLRGLYQLFTKDAEQLAELNRKFKEQSDSLAAMNESTARQQKDYSAKVEELTAKVKDLEERAAATRQKWEDQVAKLSDALAKGNDQSTAALHQERQKFAQKEQELLEANQKIKELNTMLASFRPSADQFAALQIADGTIVQATSGEDFVYISLGRRDEVRPGLTFEVYSHYQKIPPDGKGKASLKVTHVFETTSECQVLASTANDPILRDDLVANPIFDRGRQYNYLVAGDFDLNFDGKIDDPGGIQVGKLIRDAGGKIANTVDTGTDFVVLGIAPPEPRELPEDADNQAAVERNKKLAAERKAFLAVKQEAQTMGIPILTRTQFLHFLGYGVPGKVKDDPLP